MSEDELPLNKREAPSDSMTIKHATASTFLFARLEGRWVLGMIRQPRLGKVMIAGGHVEDDETAAEGGVREATEETGREVRLIEPVAPEVPDGYPHIRMPQPWWITELNVPRDNHLPVDHVHVDHVFVAVADSLDPVSEPAHEFFWLTEEEVAAHDDVFEDTKILARKLFASIGGLADEKTS